MSTYSLTPNEKPFIVKDFFGIAKSAAASSVLRSSAAFLPLIVTRAPTGRPGLRFHVGILFFAKVLTAVIPDILLRSVAALSTSAISVPAPMFKTTLSINTSRILFTAISLLFQDRPCLLRKRRLRALLIFHHLLMQLCISFFSTHPLAQNPLSLQLFRSARLWLCKSDFLSQALNA